MTQGSGFPNEGEAVTALLRACALGMSRVGADVSVHMLGGGVSTTGPQSGDGAKGEWRGLPFEHMSGSPRPASGWLRRRALELRSLWRMSKTILACGRSSDRAAVILYGPFVRFTLPIKAACAAAGVPLVHERGEFPFVYSGEPSLAARLWRSAYLATFFRLFDGVIVVGATLLEEFVRERVGKATWVLRVPTMVDAEAFRCAAAPTVGLVGYAGNLKVSHREELFQLLGAVGALAATHDDIRVRIMGGGSSADEARLAAESARLGIENRVELAGTVSGDELPAWLCGCAALALPRASGLFSSAGFPSKLSEYLATGRPVVVTATGDIPLYLRPGIDSFLVPPDDPAAFAQALERALYDPGAVDIGRAGRETARTQFDPATHMARVLDALEPSW